MPVSAKKSNQRQRKNMQQKDGGINFPGMRTIYEIANKKYAELNNIRILNDTIKDNIKKNIDNKIAQLKRENTDLVTFNEANDKFEKEIKNADVSYINKLANPPPAAAVAQGASAAAAAAAPGAPAAAPGTSGTVAPGGPVASPSASAAAAAHGAPAAAPGTSGTAAPVTVAPAASANPAASPGTTTNVPPPSNQGDNTYLDKMYFLMFDKYDNRIKQYLRENGITLQNMSESSYNDMKESIKNIDESIVNEDIIKDYIYFKLILENAYNETDNSKKLILLQECANTLSNIIAALLDPAQESNLSSASSSASSSSSFSFTTAGGKRKTKSAKKGGSSKNEMNKIVNMSELLPNKFKLW